MTEPAVTTSISGGAQSGIIGAATVTAAQIIINNYPSHVAAAPVAAGAVGPCPYPGLAYFGPNEADRFFGRDAAIAKLAQSVGRQSLTALVGPSGSGKSSVVLAGLAPRLHAGGGWLFSYFRIGDEPDREPFSALARALAPLYVASLDDTERLKNIKSLAKGLQAGELSLLDVFADCRAKNRGSRIVLIADQFEETFTLVQDGADRNRFIEALLSGFPEPVPGSRPEICLVLTLRADFYGRALSYRTLADALQGRVENLGPMNRDELRAAIVRPAEGAGVSFEPGLVETLLDRVDGKPASLPLLQFALREMWWRQDRGRITRESYDGMNGVEGALAQRAEKIFAAMTEEAASPRMARTFQRLFTRLVTLGEGQADTRRVVERRELGDEVWSLAQRLAGEDNRLVVTNAPPTSSRETAEVIHEALIRNWPRLVDWIDADRAFQSWLRGIAPSVEQWSADPSDDAPLPRGGKLAQAVEWLAARADDLSEHEAAYINAGVARRRREEQDAEAALQTELRRQRDLAESRRRQRWAAVTASVVLVAIAALALWERQVAVGSQQEALMQAQRALVSEQLAQRSQRDAVTQAQASLSRQLAAQSLGSLDDAYDLSLLLAIEAFDASDTFEARGALFSGLNRHPRVETYFRGQLEPELLGARDPHGFGLALSPDGKVAAALSRSRKNVTLFDARTGGVIDRLSNSDAELESVAFSRDGKILACGSSDGGVLLWDALSRKLLRAFAPNANARHSNVAFGSDGNAVYEISTGGLLAFDPNKDEPSPQNARVPADADRLFISKDQKLAIVGARRSDGGEPRTSTQWVDLSTGRDVGAAKSGEAIALSPSGKLVAVSSRDKIQIYDTISQKPIGRSIAGSFDDGTFTAGAFSPDDRVLATSYGDDKNIQLWDVVSGAAIGEGLSAHASMVDALLFGADGNRLTSLATDDSILSWNVKSPRALSRPFAPGRGGWNLAFGPDLLASSDKNTISLFTLRSGAISAVLQTPDLPDAHLAFSKDGETLLAWSDAPDASRGAIFDVATKARLLTLPDDGGRGGPLAISPDGRSVALVSDQKKVVLWDQKSRAFSNGVAEAGENITALAFVSADQLAIGDGGGHFLLCGLAPNAPPCTRIDGAEAIQNPDKGPLEIVASPDRRLLISTSYAAIYLWSWVARQLVHAATLDDGGMVAPAVVATEPRASLVALSGYGVDAIQIFDEKLSRTFAEKLRPPGKSEDAGTNGLAFSTDGLTLASTTDNSILFWDFDVNSWRRRACAIANRNLTPEEWDRYIGVKAYRKTCENIP